MPDSPRMRIVLSVVAAALLFAGLVAVAAVGDDGDTDLVATGERSSTTTAAPADDRAEAGGAEDAGEAGGEEATGPGGEGSAAKGSTAGPLSNQPTTTAKGATSDATTATQQQPASGEPAPLQPTKTGHYTYEVTVDGETSEASYVVEPAPAAGGDETRQVHTLKTAEGELRNELVWTRDALYLDKTSGSGGQGMNGDCDWQPDVLARKLPLKVGAAWVSDSSCSGESAYGPYELKAHFEFKVSGTARMTVGGQAVDVWVIDGTQRIDISAQYQGQPITATQEGATKTFVSGKHGLSVREESQSTTNTPMGQRATSTTRQLKSLTPA